MSIVMQPGTIRTVHFHRKRDADGKYPVTYWGALEEQIAEATVANGRATSSHDHRMMQLYTYTEDCPHSNPEEDERYAGVDDLVDEWMARNCPGLTWERGDSRRDGVSISTLIWKNTERAYAVIPVANEWRRAQDAYDDVHVSGVCTDSPAGVCCTACTEGDDDFGYESGSCRLAERIRQEYDDFWWRVSAEGVADRERSQ